MSWRDRLKQLKAEHADAFRAEGRRRRRKVDEACFTVNDGALCTHLRYEWHMGRMEVGSICTIKRCPKERR